MNYGKKIKVLKISKLILDSNIYPRFKTSWLTAYQYAMAMKSGSVFPEVIVGRLKGKFILVDGWHRIEALKLLGEEYVRAIVKDYDSEAELFADAVRFNVTHGRQLSVQEKARIIDKLESYNFTLEEISEIVRVPVDKIKRFKFKVVTAPNGSKIYLKSMTEKALTDKDLAVKVNQELLSVRDLESLLKQLIEVLKCGVIRFDKGNLRGLAVEAYSLLGEALKLTAEA